MSNLKIGPVDITSGTAKFDIGGLQVGVSQFVANGDGSVTLIGGSHVLTSNSNSIVAGNQDAGMVISSNVGYYKHLSFRAGASERWRVLSSGGAEGEGNNGSNFYISRYTNAGAFIDSPLLIDRATGSVTISNALLVPALSIEANDTRAASTSFVKASFGVVPNRDLGDSSSNAANTRFVQDAIAQRGASPKGRVIWTTPGTYTWTAPIGVTEIFVDGSAGGGGATANIKGVASGGRGESCYRYLVSVTPGTSYTVIVGSKGEATISSPYTNSSAGSGGSTTIVGKLTLAGGGGASVIGVDNTIPGINKYPIDVSPTFTLSDGRIAGMGGIGISSDNLTLATAPATDGFLLITW